MNPLSLEYNFHNSKIYFSKKELTKIFNCYFLGVSKGNWKDYAIYFGNHKTSFYIFKHSSASPECILTKSRVYKKNIIFYNLQIINKNEYKNKKIDNLIAIIKRNELKII